MKKHTTDTDLIVAQVRHGLFSPRCGNPLHLSEGEILPDVSCKRVGKGRYDLTIVAHPGVTVEALADIVSAISSALTGQFERFAVTQADSDVAYGGVTFRVEDVTTDRSLIFELLGKCAQKIPPRSWLIRSITLISLPAAPC